MHIQLRLYMFPLFTVCVTAYTTFDTKCSLPNTTINYVASPDTRGTLDILLICFFTMVACTWTVQHLNIPEQRLKQNPGWKGDIHWGFKGFRTSFKWMLATMIAPEILIERARSEYCQAQHVTDELEKLALNDGVPWTFTHTLFANMGGFVIKTRTTEAHNSQGEYPNLRYLVAQDVLNLRRAECALGRLPKISFEEINDKSNANWFVRITACFEVLYIVVSVIFRLSKKLTISQLEISTLAFAVFAVIIYAVNWSKPKGVQVPVTILDYPHEIPYPINVLIQQNAPFKADEMFYNMFQLPFASDEDKRLPPGSPIPNDRHTSLLWSYSYYLAVSCTLFGAVHCGAWNFHFPTTADKIIWRVSSVWCTAFFIFCAAFVDICNHLCICFCLKSNRIKHFRLRSLSVFGCLYVLARLALLVEVFRTLVFLPPDAYIATWTSNLPHLA